LTEALHTTITSEDVKAVPARSGMTAMQGNASGSFASFPRQDIETDRKIVQHAKIRVERTGGHRVRSVRRARGGCALARHQRKGRRQRQPDPARLERMRR